jgi:hypothetical protein
MAYADRISPLVGEYVYNQLLDNRARLPTGLDVDQISTWVQTAIEDNAPDAVALGDLLPDFEEVYARFQQVLREYDSWEDISMAGTGNMLVSVMAAAVNLLQVAVIRSAQETHRDTQKLPNSIYALARTLGNRILRRRPAEVEVTLTNDDDSEIQFIPAYSQFTIGNQKFFNRDVIVFNEGVTELEAVMLYEGIVNTEAFSSTGEQYQRIEIGRRDFTTSDSDIVVTVNGVNYDRKTDGIWKYGKVEAFSDFTTPRGMSELIFGNGINGIIPPVNETISVTWVRTVGAEANSVLTDLSVSCNDNSNIGGITTTAIENGDNQREAEHYRLVGPYGFASRGVGVGHDDMEAIALDYQSVGDCKVRGQRRINPNDNSLMCMIFITMLPIDGSVWNETQWGRFEDYMQEKSVLNFILNREDPVRVDIHLNADIYCVPNSNLLSVKTELISNLLEYFAIRRGSLGRSVYRSDIDGILKGKGEIATKITHFKLNSPGVDLAIQPLHFAMLSAENITLNMHYGERAFAGSKMS